MMFGVILWMGMFLLLMVIVLGGMVAGCVIGGTLYVKVVLHVGHKLLDVPPVVRLGVLCLGMFTALMSAGTAYYLPFSAWTPVGILLSSVALLSTGYAELLLFRDRDSRDEFFGRGFQRTRPVAPASSPGLRLP